MALVTPTTAELAETIVSQIEASISQTVPLLPKSFIRVLAKVFAGVVVILYRYAGSTHLQQYIETASTSETTIGGRTFIPLVKWGRQVGVGDPVPSSRAELNVTVTVIAQGGALPLGTQLIHAPSGILYTATSGASLDSATITLNVRAVRESGGGDGSGAIGNRAPGDVLTFVNPLGNVARDAVVAAMTEQGADGETWNAYRARVLRRWQRRPQGGAYADYEAWATSVAGIVAAYPYTGDPGEVDVYIEATEASSGSADGYPTGAQITAVEEAISFDQDGLATRRPANAAVNVLSITRTSFDVVITGLIAPVEATAQEAIDAAIDEFLRSREPYIVGLSLLPRADRVTLAAVSGVAEEAASAQGATITSVTLKESGSPIFSYTLGEGEKARAGSVTYP